MRAADPQAATAAFVAAGRPPADIAADDSAPMVKICGIVDEDGLLAAARAGADAIGLNVVAGTPRALEPNRASDLARRARALPARLEVVLVTADLQPAELLALIDTVDPDVVQLSGNEDLATLDGLPRRAWKTLRAAGEPSAVVAEAQRWLAAGCE